MVRRNGMRNESGPVSRRFPLHGWLGLLLVGLFWPLNWLLEGLRTHWGFFPLWLGYSLAVDGICQYRSGTSLLANNSASCWSLSLAPTTAACATERSSNRGTNAASMARSEKNVTQCYLNSSATQQRKNNPRMRCGRLAIDWSLRRVKCLSSLFVLA